MNFFMLKYSRNFTGGMKLMSKKIRVAIMGYGNLGRGVELAIGKTQDMELKFIFTRRAPENLSPLTNGISVCKAEDAVKYKDDIDVLILCGGSATDLPVQGPEFATYFNTVDSFDTHAKIPEYFEKMDSSAKQSGKIGIISIGWDPGMFSIQRMLFEAILPAGNNYTFWGKGVSQGHSDAIRRIDGVKNAKQYTVPVENALESVRNGENPTFITRDMHTRECYVVAEDGADTARIEKEIKTMPNYFADYNTTVNFISEKELLEKHSGIPHGGFVLRSGTTGAENDMSHVLEFSLKLDSNPEFTSSVLVAYARAAYKLNKEGLSGAKTVYDIPLSYLSSKSNEELRKELL